MSVVPWLALAFIVWLLASLRLREWIAVVAVALVALLAYRVARWRTKVAPDAREG